MVSSTRAALCAAVVISVFGESICLGQDAGPPASNDKSTAGALTSSADLEAIRAGSQAFITAFNKQDAKAVAALWTKDGEYVDDSGRAFTGRDAIQQDYARFFSENPNARIRVMIDSLRLLSDDTAIEDGRAVVEPAPAGAPGISKYTAVHVKTNGKWLMASVRDTWVETPSTHQYVADLEWLIGTWVADENGVKTVSICSWLANKCFVQRKYTVTDVDGATTSGLQIIGWNADGGYVQSWNFSPDGGHAVGVLSPHQGGWTSEIRGVTGDGEITTSVNTLTRLDDNAYVWQSVQRTIDGMALPDTDEVVVKRRNAPK